MSLPFKALDAVTTTGPGNSRDLEDSKANHAIQVSVTGDPEAWTVWAEGSLDGTNWVPLTIVTSADTYKYSRGTVSGSNYVFRYIRANCTILTGGTDPTITAWVASA